LKPTSLKKTDGYKPPPDRVRSRLGLPVQEFLQLPETFLIDGGVNGYDNIFFLPLRQIKIQGRFIFLLICHILENNFKNFIITIRAVIIEHLVLRILHHLKPIMLKKKKGFGGVSSYIVG
jgi:hypothetical protein